MEVLIRKQVAPEESEQKWLHTPLEPGRACIYAGVCTVTNKIYVGQHLWDKGKRNRSCWDRRIVTKKNEKRCHAMYNAIKKHSFTSFEWFILCVCDELRADICETTYIRWCDCISPKGYNIRGGGSRGRLHPDSIAKMKASLPFEKRSAVSKQVANRPEVKEALRKRMTGRTRKHTLNPLKETQRREGIRKKAAIKRDAKMAKMTTADAAVYLARCIKENSRKRNR